MLVPSAPTRRTVPRRTAPYRSIAVFTPLLALLGCLAAGRITRGEAHAACLLALTCVATTGLLTNWVKVQASRAQRGCTAALPHPSSVRWRPPTPGCPPPRPHVRLLPRPYADEPVLVSPQVGRPRPHFVQRCWPGGAPPAFTPEGRPKCLDASIDPEEGIKSWPSGAVRGRGCGRVWAGGGWGSKLMRVGGCGGCAAGDGRAQGSAVGTGSCVLAVVHLPLVDAWRDISPLPLPPPPPSRPHLLEHQRPGLPHLLADGPPAGLRR